MSSERSSTEQQAALTPEPEHGFWAGRAKFPSGMEEAFQAEMEVMREKHMRNAGLVALLLYGAFSLSDRVMVPDVYQQAWAIRFLLVMPIMLVSTQFIHKVPSGLLRETVLALTVILSGASLPWIAGLSSHPNANHYQTGITLIILYGNIVLNLRFRNALITSSVLAVVFGLSLVWLSTAPPEVRFSNWLFCFSAVVISLMANYRTDQEQRRAYLARTREQARNAELSHAVELLDKLSAQDALTQIANRREFDRRLDMEWSRAIRNAQPLALILIDVDYFKAYNDHYGHPAGDACLQKIAAALRALTRRSSDLVARLGGEEFVVLLPATEAHEAAELAERMRVAIRELQLPHAYSSAAPVVTGSFGVCALRPSAQLSPARLLAEADAAMYRAKNDGRDRVMVQLRSVEADDAMTAPAA